MTSNPQESTRDVERYEASAASDGDLVYPIMDLYPQGDWVQYAHYAEAASQLAALKAENERLAKETQKLTRRVKQAEAFAEKQRKFYRIERARVERAEAQLKEFGSSRVRDRIGKAVRCNLDLLHEALQAEVRAALSHTEPKQ